MLMLKSPGRVGLSDAESDALEKSAELGDKVLKSDFDGVKEALEDDPNLSSFLNITLYFMPLSYKDPQCHSLYC